MAVAPFNPTETLPEDDDFASQYPLVERTFRDIMESWMLVGHDRSGFHKSLALADEDGATPAGVADTVTIWQEDGVVFYRVGTGDAVNMSESPEATFKGRAFDADEGPTQNLTGAQAAAIISVFTVDNGVAVGLKGLVPAPAIGDAAAGKVLGSTAAFVHTGPPHAYLENQQAAGTDGGTFNGATVGTRTLNTEVYDPYGLVALASNQFTLQPGTYVIQWEAPGYRVDSHQTWLYNVTSATIPGWGSAEHGANDVAVQTWSRGLARVTITVASAFTIRHYAVTTKTTNGAGVAASFGAVGSYEVFTRVWIWKVG